MKFLFLNLLLLFTIASKGQNTPLSHAHSHNDYEQKRPLRDALEHGFTSVEADVLFIYGKLYVGHNMPEQKWPKLKTLTQQYLKPLYRHYKRNNFEIYPNYQGNFYLWIDIKFEPEQSYARLKKVLMPYKNMLNYYENGKFHAGKVTVILSGARPFDALLNDSLQLMTLDGRPSDLDKNYPSNLMPFISENFYLVAGLEREFSELSESARQRIQHFVDQAKQQGKKTRLWATPEQENLWKDLLGIGLNLLNTDRLNRLRSFLLEFKSKD